MLGRYGSGFTVSLQIGGEGIQIYMFLACEYGFFVRECGEKVAPLPINRLIKMLYDIYMEILS